MDLLVAARVSKQTPVDSTHATLHTPHTAPCHATPRHTMAEPNENETDGVLTPRLLLTTLV